MLSYLVVGGTGSVGGAIVAYLLGFGTSPGTMVKAIGRGQGLNWNSIQSNGLTVSYYKNDTKSSCTIPSSIFFPSIDLISKHSQNVVIISLKQPMLTANLMQKVLDVLAPSGVIAIIQNGLPFYFLNGLSAQHIEAVDQKGKIKYMTSEVCVTGFLPLIAASHSGPGSITVSRPLESIKLSIGSPEPHKCAKLDEVSADLNLLGLPIADHPITSSALRTEICNKLLFAITYNTISALQNYTLGKVQEDLISSKGMSRYAEFAIAYTTYVAKELSITGLKSFTAIVTGNYTKTHYSSMRYDIESSNTPEAKVIVEAITSINVPCATHEIIKPFLHVSYLLIGLAGSDGTKVIAAEQINTINGLSSIASESLARCVGDNENNSDECSADCVLF